MDMNSLNPTAYRIRSALRVAYLIGTEGPNVIDLRQSYHYSTAQGIYAPDQLKEGEKLLLQLELLREIDGRLHPTDELKVLARAPELIRAESLLFRLLRLNTSEDLAPAAEDLIEDPLRRETFLMALNRIYQPGLNSELGEAGEEYVAMGLRKQLSSLGREDLSARVCRVSLISDQLGYDITAPRLDGTSRLLEIKTSGTPNFSNSFVRLFISRNEADTGLRFRDWSLVVCSREHDGSIHIDGWCSGRSLQTYLPNDGVQSEWLQAHLTIPITLLVRGLPDPA